MLPRSQLDQLRRGLLPAAFDAVFTVIGVRIIRTPVRALRANSVMERWSAAAGVSCWTGR